MLLYDPDGTALTGFTDIGVIAYESSGNKDKFVYTLRTKNAEGQLGPPATVTVTVPLQPAYSPTAPTGFRLTTGPRLGWIEVNWNRADWRTPAYVIQWRKSDQDYPATASGGRSATQTWTDGPDMVGADGGQYMPNRTTHVISCLEFGTLYYVRVGTCATSACVVTSNAVVGSSAMTSSGLLTSAMAIMQRCLIPPLSRNG